MKHILIIIAGLCMVCQPFPKCDGEVCIMGTVCEYQPCESKGPPVGCHSHATKYNITYTQADLQFNKTRSDIRYMLKNERIL